jgi:hypothetical protein
MKQLPNVLLQNRRAPRRFSDVVVQVMVSVVNQKSTAVTNLRIDVVGRVNLKFITDYFPLLPAAEPQ